MKIIAYTALLYGTDYLGWAIRSVIDSVDEYHVIYDMTGHGSHGHVTDRICPDTREQLFAIAQTAAGDKLRWHDGAFAHEGYQRDAIHQYAPDADVILVLDADEIWNIPYLPRMLSSFISNPDYQMKRSIRVPIIHYWRSFYRAVLRDPAYPTRIIIPSLPEGEQTLNLVEVKPINHMGYAQRSELVEFKQHTHGHKGEWRQDDWFNTVFMANAQTNCHPVGSEYWNPEQVDPMDYMPAFMKDHPYFNMEVIP